MRSINRSIHLRPRSNAAEAEVQKSEAKPRLSLVPAPNATQAVRRWAADHRWAFVMILVLAVFTVAFAIFVLSPALTTLGGNSVEAWSQP